MKRTNSLGATSSPSGCPGSESLEGSGTEEVIRFNPVLSSCDQFTVFMETKFTLENIELWSTFQIIFQTLIVKSQHLSAFIPAEWFKAEGAESSLATPASLVSVQQCLHWLGYHETVGGVNTVERDKVIMNETNWEHWDPDGSVEVHVSQHRTLNLNQLQSKTVVLLAVQSSCLTGAATSDENQAESHCLWQRQLVPLQHGENRQRLPLREEVVPVHPRTPSLLTATAGEAHHISFKGTRIKSEC